MQLTPSNLRTDNPGIDFTRRFIAEEFTPLFYTSEYRGLPDVARLRYNQLHALYFNEQVAFFEQEMLSPALLGLLRRPLPTRLAAGVRIFFEEEQRHTATFHALNRRCAPDLYSNNPSCFIRLAHGWAALLSAVSRRPRLFPLLPLVGGGARDALVGGRAARAELRRGHELRVRDVARGRARHPAPAPRAQ